MPGLPFIWYLLKVAVCLFVFIWLRATLPRIRYDRLMRFGWQTLLPLAVLNLLVTSAVVTLVPTTYQWAASLAFSLLVIAVASVIYAWRMRQARREQRSATKGGVTMPTSVRLVRWDEATVPQVEASQGPAGATSPSGVHMP